MADELIQVEARLNNFITPELNKINSGLKDTGVQLDNTSNKAGFLERSFEHSFTRGLRHMVGMTIGFGALVKSIEFASKSIEEYNEAQTEMGNLSDNQIKSIQDHNKALETFKMTIGKVFGSDAKSVWDGFFKWASNELIRL